MSAMRNAWGKAVVLAAILGLTPSGWPQDAPKIPSKGPVRGYLVDLLCTRQRAKEGVKLGEVHTKMCLQMPPCESSGYAVMTPDYQILRFDDKGNDKAKKLLEKTNQASNFVVLVSGKIKDDEIEVSRIDLLK